MSILNKFMHKKKIPLIPPILLNNNFITDISENAHLLSVFFANQCKIIQNKNTLPVFAPKTDCVLEHVLSLLKMKFYLLLDLSIRIKLMVLITSQYV